MPDYTIRTALLDDVDAIRRLACAKVGVWQRMGQDGFAQDVPYETLSVYERWLHGGPWMSLETGALQLGLLRSGAGLALVAALPSGQLCGYMEIYQATEPAPYGAHLHVGTLYTHPDYADVELALLQGAQSMARQQKLKRLTVNIAASDTHNQAQYSAYGFRQIDEVRRMIVTAKAGQVFYRAVEHLNANPAQIEGWHMSIGRLGSSRYQWETLWHRTWDVIPEVKARRIYRLSFNAAGNDAFVLIREQLYVKRWADVFCWTPKPPTGQLIMAISDWAQREGFKRLVMPTVSSAVNVLGLDAEPDGYIEHVYALE